MTWQPIETAPLGVTVLVADENAGILAVAHQRLSGWLLGMIGMNCDGLEFEPRWWLPWDYAGNPFDAPLPDAPDPNGHRQTRSIHNG